MKCPVIPWKNKYRGFQSLSIAEHFQMFTFMLTYLIARKHIANIFRQTADQVQLFHTRSRYRVPDDCVETNKRLKPVNPRYLIFFQNFLSFSAHVELLRYIYTRIYLVFLFDSQNTKLRTEECQIYFTLSFPQQKAILDTFYVISFCFKAGLPAYPASLTNN